MKNDYDANAKWGQVHESKRQEAEQRDKEAALKARRENLANQKFILAQMQDNDRKRKTQRHRELKSEMEACFGAKGIQQDEDTRVLTDLKKSWVKMNQ